MGAVKVGPVDSWSLGLLHELYIERNRHFLANKDTPRLKCGIPYQSEILAIDLGHSRKADASITPRILRRSTRAFRFENHAARDAVDSEITFDGQFIVPTSARV